MSYVWQVHLVLATGMFVVGAVVGSFLNVCIYRIPLEKSVIWPSSRCPNCLGPIGSLQNIPIASWIGLGGSCRSCGLRISGRYPLVEALVGVLFVAVYLLDAQYAFPSAASAGTIYLAVAYHCVLVALLVAISYIDYDWTIVPAVLTNFGLLFGLLVPLFDPAIRPVPSTAATPLGGFGVGLIGAAAGGGIVLAVRVLGGIVFRREAMGSGDIHILAVVGAFLGWEAAVLAFFFSAFFGLIPAILKLVPYLIKRATGRSWDASEREIPFGPFLAMAAGALLLTWPWIWPKWLAPHAATLAWLVRYSLGQGE